MKDDLKLVIEAARAAGALALRTRTRGLTVTRKADDSPVTNGDLAVDRLLRDTLLAARPHYGWLSEETVDDRARLGQEVLFVVDPIDGTRAYIQNRPWFTVCIAVVRAGRPAAAAVYAPELDEMFEASAGAGARLNGKPIRVSDTDTLEDCEMAGDAKIFGDPRWPTPWPAMNVQSRNSVAYRMALVASGGFDAAVALNPKSDWDVAAAELIVAEAGGLATDHLGRPFVYNRPVPLQRSLVCANRAVHPLILERVAHIDSDETRTNR